MDPLTCPEVEDQLDLYAAGECDPTTRAAVAGHLAGCPACAADVVEARRLQGLLDLHGRTGAGLQRLHAKIDKEDRRLRSSRRVLPFAGRALAAAALVVLTFGLTALGPEQAGLRPAAFVADVGVSTEMRAVPGAVEVHPPHLALMAKDDVLTVTLDRGGKTADEYRRSLEGSGRAGTLPLPPAVDLSLELRNPGPEERTLHLEDERANLSLELSGPGVLRLNAPGVAEALLPSKSVRLGPGASWPLPIRRLIGGTHTRRQYLYWTEPGEYTLTIRFQVPASAGWPGRPEPNLSANDLERITFASRPVRIRVVERR